MNRPCLIVSPFMHDVLMAVSRGATPYLALKRAELNERRRSDEARARAEASGISDASWAGLHLQAAP